jgi:hypothetical protein
VSITLLVMSVGQGRSYVSDKLDARQYRYVAKLLVEGDKEYMCNFAREIS